MAVLWFSMDGLVKGKVYRKRKGVDLLNGRIEICAPISTEKKEGYEPSRFVNDP